MFKSVIFIVWVTLARLYHAFKTLKNKTWRRSVPSRCLLFWIYLPIITGVMTTLILSDALLIKSSLYPKLHWNFWQHRCLTSLVPRARDSVRWRHNGRDGVSNHRRYDYSLNRLCRRRLKNTSMLPVTALREGNSPMTGEFPSKRDSNAENASIWWCHRIWLCYILLGLYHRFIMNSYELFRFICGDCCNGTRSVALSLQCQ